MSSLVYYFDERQLKLPIISYYAFCISLFLYSKYKEEINVFKEPLCLPSTSAASEKTRKPALAWPTSIHYHATKIIARTTKTKVSPWRTITLSATSKGPSESLFWPISALSSSVGIMKSYFTRGPPTWFLPLATISLGRAKEIKEEVRNCLLCQKSKITGSYKYGKLPTNNRSRSELWDGIHVNLIIPWNIDVFVDNGTKK